uniref:Uncharacterized protein n=1 Tax=Ixodes ricinus TaxID=34613 RepID=A0A6B0U3T2_IXORI
MSFKHPASGARSVPSTVLLLRSHAQGAQKAKVLLKVLKHAPEASQRKHLPAVRTSSVTIHALTVCLVVLLATRQYVVLIGVAQS